MNSPQNPYSISVGGAASLNLLRSKAEVEATRRARQRSFMVTFGVALRIQRRLDTVNLEVTFIVADKAG